MKKIIQIQVDREMYAWVEKLYYFISEILKFAVVNGYIKQSCIAGIKLKDLYPGLNKQRLQNKDTLGNGWIETDKDLQNLICFILDIKSEFVRNTCILGLLTGLRGMNIRKLHFFNLEMDQNTKKFYLSFSANEMKIEKNGAFELGVSCDVFDLAGIVSAENLNHQRKNMATENKELRKFQVKNVPAKSKSYLTFHSFRNIFSIFMNRHYGHKFSRQEIDMPCTSNSS